MQQLTLLYIAFAAISSSANLGSQWFINQLYSGPNHIIVSILIGTAAGLVSKYFLDKRWIFYYRTVGVEHELKTFMLYTIMGGSTTLIFWGVELFFHWIFASEVMRYLGGMLGLMIGYIIKYMLDKRLVFK